MFAEARDSVGLSGRSRGIETGTSETTVFGLEGESAPGGASTPIVGLRGSRVLGARPNEVPEPLIMASLRRKSSNGAPGAPGP